MPKKSIREMSELEKRHHSLAARMFHTTIIGSIILGLVALVIGLLLYAYALGEQYINGAYNLTKNVESVVDNVVDVRGYGRETMRAYREADDTMRSEQNVRYLSDFAKVRFDESFTTLMGVLSEFTISSDVDFLYIGMYDEETSALVFVADADEDRTNRMKTGMWMTVDKKEIDKFLNAEDGERTYYISRDDKYGWMCTCGVPVYDTDGSIACFILADVSLLGLIAGMRDFVIQFSLAILVMVLVFGYLMSRHMKKSIVTPINKIADAAVEYVDDKKSGAENKEHFRNLEINTGDEIENLYFILSDMESDLNGYEKDLAKAIMDKERIGTELNLARRIQADMLPNTFPAFPDRLDFDIYASMIPAKEVGGDFYDYFLVDDDHLAMLIADVSGKGIPATLFMMASKILLDTATM